MEASDSCFRVLLLRLLAMDDLSPNKPFLPEAAFLTATESNKTEHAKADLNIPTPRCVYVVCAS